MINEARTLLMNVDSSGRFAPGANAEEYIPPQYKPVVTDSAVENVREILFGKGSDQLTQNYKAAQYMQLLHSNDLALEHILAFDPRYTYTPDYSVYAVAKESDITEVIAMLKSRAGLIVSLCKGGQAEPYKTCYNLFQQAPNDLDKLVGVLLAVIYRTREIWQG